MQETVEDGPFFCFQGADFEVHPAKIIQTEVAFCKTEVKFAIYHSDILRKIILIKCDKTQKDGS